MSICLQHNTTLVSLTVSCNELGNIGGMYFAECIQLNKGLIHLDLGDTDLVSNFADGDIGVRDGELGGQLPPQFGQFVDINSGRESTLFGQNTIHV